MSQVTYIAPTRSNAILEQIDRASEAFSAQPEIFRPEFWDEVWTRATDIKTAQIVLDELDAFASEGVTVSKFVSIHLVQAMREARATLRNHEMRKVNAS